MQELGEDDQKKKECQKRFGEHLRSFRKERNITASSLASLCDLPRSSIARLESGRINPSLYFLTKLSDGLEISVSDLLKGF